MENLHYYFTPTKAFVLYEASKAGSFVQVHEVLSLGKSFQLGAGMPVSDDDLDDIAREFNQLKDVQPLTVKGIIPRNVLHYSGTEKKFCIIWYIPSKVHYLHFEMEELKSGKYILPGLIFKATHNDIDVFAFKGAEPLTEQTKLWIPPLFNTAKEGSVCMGNAELMQTDAFVESKIAAWERAFFGSKFTHATEGNNMVQSVNVFQYYKWLADEKLWGSEITEKFLIPTNQTVEDLFDE